MDFQCQGLEFCQRVGFAASPDSTAASASLAAGLAAAWGLPRSCPASLICRGPFLHGYTTVSDHCLMISLLQRLPQKCLSHLPMPDSPLP